MANGEFLRGISRGIFGEMGQAEQEQKTRDREKTLQTIDFLSNMASQVEPDSLPMLMDILGKTIGVKGKTKNFWSAFGGTPDRSIEDQLGTIMNQATSSMIGPETARQARGEYKQQLLQPFRDEGTRPRSVEAFPYKTPPTLADRLILRDPRQEGLEEIRTRYGSQLENQRVMQQERYVDALGRQENQSRLKLGEMSAKSQLDSLKAINALSNQLLAGDKTLTPQQAVEKAGDILGSTAEARLAALRSLEPLRSAQTIKAQVEAKSMQKTGGLTPQQDIGVKKSADAIRKTIVDAEAGLSGFKQTLATAKAGIESAIKAGKIKGRFDPNTGTINYEDLAGSAMAGFVGIPQLLKDYKEALSSMEKASRLSEGNRKTLSTSPYNRYYKVDTNIGGTIDEVGKKAIPPQKPLKPGERVGISEGIRVSREQGDQSGYSPGKKVTIGPRNYIVDRLQGGFWILKPVTK